MFAANGACQETTLDISFECDAVPLTVENITVSDVGKVLAELHELKKALAVVIAGDQF